ncbi:MAG: arylsulfatase [Planctomycetota bacterium]|nr:arylsulfatase [Planctomycetota bacterium]
MRITLSSLFVIVCCWDSAIAEKSALLPNIIFILADDLGYEELGCYGQKKIRTPNIDRLASEGMRFTRHYSGSPVCAPSRCVLMTGKHPGHAFVRNNSEVKPEGQSAMPPSEITIAQLLKKSGYTCGAFGKWGLGFPGSASDPLNKGLDRFYGYNCQRHAHSYYPNYLWDDDKRIRLDNEPPVPGHARLPKDADPNDPASYERYKGKDYASDRIAEQALKFIRDNRAKPFFLYYPTIIPHLALHVPDDSLKEYAALKWKDPPDHARYTPHFTPRAAYAAMITRMDSYVGRITALLEELDLKDNTIVIFTSDNGATYLGPMAKFFQSVGPLRGLKGQSYEGGLRVPAIIRYPGKVKPGTTSDFLSGFEDWMPTLLNLANGSKHIPDNCDGTDLTPVLTGNSKPQRPFLYREFQGYGGQQALWIGKWKGIRNKLRRGPSPIELYNLKEDISEKKDVAQQHPEIVSKMASIMKQEHVPSERFPVKGLDKD